MLAFHNDPKLKADLLIEVEKHRLADQIVRGTYGKGSNGDWKGCSIGCAIHSLNRIKGLKHATNDHSALASELGVPLVLLKLNDYLFESLPHEEYLSWPERFLAAIRPGADLSKVWPQLAHWLMVDPEHGVLRFANENTKPIVERVAYLYANNGSREEFAEAPQTRAAAAAAAGAAWAAGAAARAAWAAEAAEAAAGAAARAAWAAAWAAEAAAWAAEAAARAAEAAARAAAEAEHHAQANKLIELLRAA